LFGFGIGKKLVRFFEQEEFVGLVLILSTGDDIVKVVYWFFVLGDGTRPLD
jgi:hypothetical protein